MGNKVDIVKDIEVKDEWCTSGIPFIYLHPNGLEGIYE